jgi:hypothetical protein
MPIGKTTKVMIQETLLIKRVIIEEGGYSYYGIESKIIPIWRLLQLFSDAAEIL